jgi:glycosyltransferase involved in cell wall biosynthesis/predicted transcriptional regulator
LRGPRVKAAPSVSVVIPLYNHAQYIEATVNSVLAQTVAPLEIIVIDDGSSDASADIMRRLCLKHPEIIFWSWPNQGAHHTLNAGIFRATGDFVSVLNSDDLYAPDRLACCLAEVGEGDAVDVVATVTSFVDGQGQTITNPWYDDALAFYRRTVDLPTALLHANFLVSTSNFFVRRTVFEALGGFAPLRYAHDLDFALRLVLARKKFGFIDRPLLSYRLHGSNTISENKEKEDLERAVVFALFLDRRWHGTEGSQLWLKNCVEVFGQQDLLAMVEEALRLLDSPATRDGMNRDNALPTAMRGFLDRLGLDWVRRSSNEPLMAQFVAARKTFQRRQIRSTQLAKLEADVDWLTGQRDAWMQSAKASEKEVASLSAATAELRAGNDWLLAQKTEWERLAVERESQIGAVATALEDARKGNDWLLTQKTEWERLAAERESQIGALTLALEDARKGNDWLLTQKTEWERLAAERESQIGALTLALEDARKGNDWLLTQKTEWERLAAERESQIGALTLALEDARKGNDWLVTQRDAWEQAAKATHLDLLTCEAALKTLRNQRVFRLLTRVGLLDLNYTFKATDSADGAKGSPS